MGFDKGIQIQATQPRLIAGHALGKVLEGEEITQEPAILIRSCAIFEERIKRRVKRGIETSIKRRSG